MLTNGNKTIQESCYNYMYNLALFPSILKKLKEYFENTKLLIVEGLLEADETATLNQNLETQLFTQFY